MKRHLFGLLSVTGLAVLAGCFGSNDSSDETDSAQGAATADKLDDAFASTVLAGGCDVVVGGTRGKTKGTGGACPTDLTKVMDLLDTLQGEEAPHVFVVSEKGDLPKEADTTFRFVVSAKNKKNPFYVATVGGKSIGEGSTEAIGFSPALNAFAYYRVEGGVWVRKGDGTQVKSTTDGKDRPFECITCHTTGAPLMKELHDSWGNWTSTWFSVETPDGPNKLFKRLFDKAELADDLEIAIIDGIHKHSKGRVDRAAKEGKLKGVLTQLMCEVGEPSLIGAHSANSTRMKKVETFSSMMPGAILMNQMFVPPETGGTGTELGLEQSLSLSVPSMSDLGQGIDADAYSKAIVANGQKIGGKAGDTIFPMSSPEKSYADLDAVQELLRQKLIDKEIVSDILMTDYTVSSFSKVRCDLAKTMPETWKTPAELKTAWAKALDGSPVRGAKGLKARLEKSDIKDAEKKLEAFAGACKARPAAEFTVDVLKIMSQRRVEFAEQYESVIESPWLIPTDNLGSKAHAIRLSAACTIEPATNKFDGED